MITKEEVEKNGLFFSIKKANEHFKSVKYYLELVTRKEGELLDKNNSLAVISAATVLEKIKHYMIYLELLEKELGK